MNIDTKALISKDDTTINLLKKEDKCDKYDYLIAVACGVLGGMVDVFLVGQPGDSILGEWTDKQVDKVVMGFAKTMGWNPKGDSVGNVKSAIGFLEHGTGSKDGFQGFKVNYDQRKPSDVGSKFNIAPKTHHMMSLAHSPDIIGLFFSIVNQFTSTSSFIANGSIITVDTETFELKGGDFVSKLFCGVVNWFGHLMSDVAGGSGAHGRGTGIVMPFYELFGLCDFGSFSTSNGRKTLAELAQSAFAQGYDLRFGLAQAIPVLVTELSIKVIWAIRQYFQYKKSFKECIPYSGKHSDLRVMLLIGNGTLCVIDGIDAGMRSGGDALLFFMRLNLTAWLRFVMLVIKEICIRLGIAADIDATIESFMRINEALKTYLLELEKIDIVRFEKETELYNCFFKDISKISNQMQLNEYLLNVYSAMGVNKPWEGGFDDFMNDESAKLVFK